MKWNETPFDLQLFAEADNGSLLKHHRDHERGDAHLL